MPAPSWKPRAAAWDRLGLALYLALVVTITCIHDVRALALGVLLTALLAGRDLPLVARKAALAVLVFSGVVSLSYLAAGILRGGLSWTFLARLNLRVLLLSSLSFLLPLRVDLLRALSYPPAFQSLLLLAYGQIMTFRRIMQDFGLALKSRSLRPPGWRDHYRQRAAMATFFLEKSLRDSQEITMAMSSRGFFLDRD